MRLCVVLGGKTGGDEGKTDDDGVIAGETWRLGISEEGKP